MNTQYRTRTGFTLVEMLIVIMMIAILAGLALRGLQSAQDYSAKMRTKATISKINRFVMTKYASYQYRYIPNVTGSTAQERASSRLQLLRQLQKEEMPDLPNNFVNGSTATARRINQLTSNGTKLHNTSAELLYLIVMGEEGADASFSSAEIGDTDGNGLMEFLDGWGRPIWFIRWPAGHSSCNLKNYGVLSDIQTGDATNQHDPFDPMKVDASAFAVFPLIFSSGPDGNKGVIMGSNETTPWQGSAGLPGEGDVNGNDSAKKTKLYFDNISNHYLD